MRNRRLFFYGTSGLGTIITIIFVITVIVCEGHVKDGIRI